MPADRPPSPVAVVTGAGAARVGNCVVRHLAQVGYDVVVHANRSLDAAEATAAQLRQTGRQAIAVQAQLSDEQSVRDMLTRVIDHFGHVEALVNCAAIWEPRPLEEVTAADVRRHFDVNALGTFLGCQLFGLHMAAQPHGGSIVNVGDWATVRPYENYAAYFPSKGAIPTLTRCFAVELARRNPRVRVNAVLPGPVMLPADLPEEERQAAIAGTLLKKEGSRQHVASAVEFLLDNDFVTGVCLPVDGGRTIA